MRKVVLVLAIFSGFPSVQAMAVAPAKSATQRPVIQVPAPPPIVRTAPLASVVKLPDPGPATPTRWEIANQLVQAVLPEGLMVEGVLLGWQKGLEKEQDSFAKLDALSPGLGAELEKRGRDELVLMVKEDMPALHATMAEIYATSATDDELRQILAFYRTPAGQKLIRNVAMGVEVPETTGNFTAEQLTQATTKAAVSAFGALTSDERVALIKLGMSPAGRRMRAMTPAVQQASADWLNALMARVPDRLAPIIEATISERIKGK